MYNPGHFLLLTLIFSTIPISIQTQPINPFSPKASLLRFWSRLFPTNPQIPTILLSKSSPLNSTQLAVFSRYIDSHTLPNHILSFCSSANLFCDLNSSQTTTHDIATNSDFENYSNKQFKEYQKGGTDGGDAFKTYSPGENEGRDSFIRYGEDGNSMGENFQSYSANSNEGISTFKSYGANGQNEINGFSRYGSDGNVQIHDFTAYASQSNEIVQGFNSYAEKANVVGNGFKSYGPDANSLFSSFRSYANNSNILSNNFKSYNRGGNAPIDEFNVYGSNAFSARNNFSHYDDEASGGLDEFSNYAEGTTGSINGFQSYGKGTIGLLMDFKKYGFSENEFVEYGKKGLDGHSRFSEYFINNTDFKKYSKSTATIFSEYKASFEAGRSRFAVETGKFFRAANLTFGKRIVMPDLRDKMPRRSFLPKVLAEKLPFSSSRLMELVEMLSAKGLESLMRSTLTDCERPAVKDETKRCVASVEAMTEFAVSVIGKAATVSSTANTNGWGNGVIVGKVVRRNGGNVTRSVSCHQSLFPYLAYYCHAVPRVKVYDVELLDEENGKKVNDGVAICHMDTTQWSRRHGAFVALGSKPGEIEVCHWIFENDLIWVGHN